VRIGGISRQNREGGSGIDRYDKRERRLRCDIKYIMTYNICGGGNE
jgi:hypothetical protein